MPNRLARETSPYLLQHAANPVDWHPWGDEALALARAADRPILLSIGYAACHWCHVMAHESFENEETARLMNELFVNIKVDREERPDLDAIYMSAVQAMTGHGGWPMTVFLTPAGLPFHGGTYYPPDDRHGMPGFRRVLRAVHEAYASRRGSVERIAEQLRAMYAEAAASTGTPGALGPRLLQQAYESIALRYDARHGGFGTAPKFPQAMALEAVLAHWRRTGDARALGIARHSFVRMARGGICDQVGGGFHRYSVDERWLVPHFEKMLYDNALLTRLGVHLWQATGNAEVRRVTEETLDWALREMTLHEGGFASSLDADSEGHEGRFYVWHASELDGLLGDSAPAARAYWGVSEAGNFEGANILHVPRDADVVAAQLGVAPAALAEVIEQARATLHAARSRRVWPARDEKIIASWNGLMLRALAEAARAFGEMRYRVAALAHGEFLFRALVREGRAMRTHSAGASRLAGFLEDHAALGLAALSLYELGFDAAWVARARELAAAVQRWFLDEASGVFFDTASDQPALIARPREVTDNATPSGTSLATELLLRLAALTGDTRDRERAELVISGLAEPMARHALAFGHLLGAADMAIHGATEVALVGKMGSHDFQALEAELARRFVPALVLAGANARHAALSDVPLLRGRTSVGGAATAYVCRNFACELPVTQPEALAAQVESAVRGASPARAT